MSSSDATAANAAPAAPAAPTATAAPDATATTTSYQEAGAHVWQGFKDLGTKLGKRTRDYCDMAGDLTTHVVKQAKNAMTTQPEPEKVPQVVVMQRLDDQMGPVFCDRLTQSTNITKNAIAALETYDNKVKTDRTTLQAIITEKDMLMENEKQRHQDDTTKIAAAQKVALDNLNKFEIKSVENRKVFLHVKDQALKQQMDVCVQQLGYNGSQVVPDVYYPGARRINNGAAAASADNGNADDVRVSSGPDNSVTDTGDLAGDGMPAAGVDAATRGNGHLDVD